MCTNVWSAHTDNTLKKKTIICLLSLRVLDSEKVSDKGKLYTWKNYHEFMATNLPFLNLLYFQF